MDLFVIYDSHLCCHIIHLNHTLGVNISPKLIMTQTCNYELYYKKSSKLFLKINVNMQKLYFKVVAILRPYIKRLIPEMKLRVLNIDGLFIKVSITDVRG